MREPRSRRAGKGCILLVLCYRLLTGVHSRKPDSVDLHGGINVENATIIVQEILEEQKLSISQGGFLDNAISWFNSTQPCLAFFHVLSSFFCLDRCRCSFAVLHLMHFGLMTSLVFDSFCFSGNYYASLLWSFYFYCRT